MDSASDNPLLEAWGEPLGLPPFERIQPEHFEPAFEAAMADQVRAVAAIAESAEPPTFVNTIAALEVTGLDPSRIQSAFFHLAGAATNDLLQAVERRIAPRLARHSNAILLNQPLFARIEALWRERDAAALDPEQRRVLERYRTDFVRAGAALDEAGRERLQAIAERLAELGTAFSQNVLADENGFMLVLDGEGDLAGLPDWAVAAAAEAARERGLDGKHVITLARSSVEPFLQFSTRRDLREQAFNAWASRGESAGPSDNRALIAETVALRAERARLLGYPTFADYRLADTMAKTPEAVNALLNTIWDSGKRRAAKEETDLQALAADKGGNFRMAPWDWRHYAERLRKRRFDVDEAALKPYLQLDKMIAAAFDTANRLFGLAFEEVKELTLYNPEVRVWRVTRADGRFVGIFLGDYFARASKRSGAWMGSLRSQHKLAGEVRPIVVNVTNFAKAPAGQPTLLSFDDARTLFHEFGHALHGLMSDVTYPHLWGTHVARDFVELPSQLFEHWLKQPEVLGRFALHKDTGEPMPRELLDRVIEASTFNQGFATVEYTASAIVDMALHSRPDASGIDVADFERRTLEAIGMPAAIAMRHRTPHFAHIFAGDYYAACYYSYLWSEVLDADAFEAFEEAGDPFDPAIAARLAEFVYTAGNLRDPAEAYTGFRGRLPTTAALLRKRGLA